MKTNHWYIIHGRAWGDDDDSCLRFNAESVAEAHAMFTEEMCCDPAKEGQPGGAFIITTFDCGNHKPECV